MSKFGIPLKSYSGRHTVLENKIFQYFMSEPKIKKFRSKWYNLRDNGLTEKKTFELVCRILWIKGR